MTKGEKTATALLLFPIKGEINGLICFTSAQSNLGDDCFRVAGKMSQYDGRNHIELQGTGIKQAKINQTKALIDFPIEGDTSSPYRMFVTSTAGSETEVGGSAIQYLPKYKNGQFFTSAGSPYYTPPITHLECVCFDWKGCTPCE